MLNKIKKILGVDGLQVFIICRDNHVQREEMISGELLLNPKYDLAIEYAEIRLIEKYIRGHLRNKKSDEYEVAKLKTAVNIQLYTGKVLTVPFLLPYDLLKSQMDVFGSRNRIFGVISRGAKFLRGVKSQFRIEVEVKVKGNAVKVFSSKSITLL